MTFSSRLRLFLILTAVIPLLIICWIIYSQTLGHLESTELEQVRAKVTLYNNQLTQQKANLKEQLNNLVLSDDFSISINELKSIGHVRNFPEVNLYRFDYLEIIDSNFTVIASYNRPSRVGNKIDGIDYSNQIQRSIEFDTKGSHASRSFVQKVDPNLFVVAGQYVSQQSLLQLSQLLDVNLSLVMSTDSLRIFSELEQNKIYKTDNGYRSVVEGSTDSEFIIVSAMSESDFRPMVNSLIGKAAIVGLFAAIAAILFGFWLTGQSKREVDNLLVATNKIAGGDFDSPIMAYQEGEFSRLADGLSEMTSNLKRVRRELATSEKIAAWQIIGRKVAHEIKNPLTPIAISTEDLRRSYHEKLDGFDGIFDETTTMIQSEVNRLSELLDEFVSFARMRPPQPTEFESNDLIESLTKLYRSEVESDSLLFAQTSSSNKLKADLDLLRQVLVNLIKNGFESEGCTKVNVTIDTTEQSLKVKIEDNGSGFNNDLLANSFEPYSSSKPKGSGLGLVICHRIISDHGGLMELYNHEKGGGVQIILPQ